MYICSLLPCLNFNISLFPGVVARTGWSKKARACRCSLSWPSQVNAEPRLCPAVTVGSCLGFSGHGGQPTGLSARPLPGGFLRADPSWIVAEVAASASPMLVQTLSPLKWSISFDNFLTFTWFKKKNKNTWLLSLNTFLAWALISKHVTAALACPRFAGLLTHFTALWFASLLDNLQVPAVRRFMEESGSGSEMRPGQAAERGWTWGGLKSGAMWGWHLNLSPTLFVTSGRACAQLYG